MITTSRNETFYKIEMTSAQAFSLHVFMQTLSHSDIDAVLLIAKIQPGTKESAEIQEALNCFCEALRLRQGP